MAWRWPGNKPFSKPMMVRFTTHICVTRPQWVNSLAPGRLLFNFKKVICKLTLVNGGWGISYEIALRWMPLDLTYDKSTLVQVMACCLAAPSHYLSQCWPDLCRQMASLGLNELNLTQWHIGVMASKNECKGIAIIICGGHGFDSYPNQPKFLYDFIVSCPQHEHNVMHRISFYQLTKTWVKYLALLMPWLLMSWQNKEPRHEQ